MFPLYLILCFHFFLIGHGSKQRFHKIKRVQLAAFDNTKSPQVLNPDWMKKLNNNTLLSSLSVPGTHDSMARYGGFLAECQTWKLNDQYKAGIRFVDIRCRDFGNSLPIHHGPIYQHAVFSEDVVHPTREFLDAHPDEFVIMNVQEEKHKPVHGDYTFWEKVKMSFDAKAPGRYIWDQIPRTIGEARGKILVVSQEPNAPCASWWEVFDSVENHWDIPTLFDVSDKKKEVQKNLDEARHYPDEWDLTFTTGSGLLAYPGWVAWMMNDYVKSYLDANPGHNHFGIVAMDFPGAKMVQEICDSNHKVVHEA